MAIKDKDEDEQNALAEEHALELESLINGAVAVSDDAYAKAQKAARDKEKRESALASLGVALGLLLSRSRKAASNMAAMHSRDELESAIGKNVERITIPFGPEPKPADVAQYIKNAIELARAAETIDSTAYRGRTIIITETVKQYDLGKDAVFDYLKRLPKETTQDAGFEVARKQSDIDNADKKPTEDALVVLALEWCAILDRSTCTTCSALHGTQAPIGQAFAYGNPPIHALCRCFVRLVTVGYTPTEKAMKLPSKKEPYQARIHCFIDERAAFDEQSRTIKGAIASDESIDSHGSIIRVDGWNLQRYQKNPVLLWAHKSGGWHAPEPEDVLGSASVRIEGTRLVADLHFSPQDVNPKAERVFRQMQAKVIRGISVGFRPQSYHFEKDAGGDEIFVSDKQELVELSIVPVPSNANTLANEFRGYLQACGCHPEDSCAADSAPQKENTMSTSAILLPAAIAALLSVESVDDAVREISKKDLELDKAQKDKRNAEERAVKAEKALSELRETGIVETVDGLIAAGTISKDKRESAIVLARNAPEQFRDMYPPTQSLESQLPKDFVEKTRGFMRSGKTTLDAVIAAALDVAPRAKQLTSRIVSAEDQTLKDESSDTGEDPITRRAHELLKEGAGRRSWLEAFSIASSEYHKKKAASGV